jgi:hypothetical protein
MISDSFNEEEGKSLVLFDDDDEIILDACDGKNDVIFLDPVAVSLFACLLFHKVDLASPE